MEATTGFHDRVPNPGRQEADGLFHDPVACHPTHGMFDADAAGGDSAEGSRPGGGSSPPRGVCLGGKIVTPWRKTP